jgi:hypothetical protein
MTDPGDTLELDHRSINVQVEEVARRNVQLDVQERSLQPRRSMTMTQRMARWGGARLSRRLSRSLPWVGGAIALATVASTMRRKGMISGVLDTGLNAVPFVGAAKNVLEVARGRDFFPDRYGPAVARRSVKSR